mmetsp:Transcript_34145/g.76869  ORF Transcript_34145/g.76869 Transcript_34145/m.76869 type:complete len:1110 (-) Transcript_34145:1437-4766(-)
MMRGAWGRALLVSVALISFSSAFHIQRASLLRTPRAKRTQSSATIESVEREDEVAPFRELLRDEIERPVDGEQEVITLARGSGDAGQADDVQAAKNDEKFKGSPEAVQVEQTREGEQEVIAKERSTGEVARTDGVEAAKQDEKVEGSPEAGQVRERDASEGESTSVVVGDEPSPPAVSTVTTTEAKAVPDIAPPPNLAPSPSTDDIVSSSQLEERGEVMTRSSTEPEKPSTVQVEMIKKAEEAEYVGKVSTSDSEGANKVVTKVVIEPTQSSESPGTQNDAIPLNEEKTAETTIKSSAISQENGDMNSASDTTQSSKMSSELKAALSAEIESESAESRSSPESLNDQTTESNPLPLIDEATTKPSAISQDKGDMKSASDDVATQSTEMSSEPKAAPVADLSVEAESESPKSPPLPTFTDDQTTKSNSFSWSGGKVMDMISGKDITLDPAPTSTKETQYLTQQVASPFSTLAVPSVDLNDSGVVPILFGGITFTLAVVGFVSRQTAETELVNEGQEGEAPWVQENILDKFEGESSENVVTKISNEPVEAPLVTSPPSLAPSTIANGDEKGGADQVRDSLVGSSREPPTKTSTPLPAFGLSKSISSLPVSPDFDGERTPQTQALNSKRDKVTAGVAEVTSQSDKIAEEMLDSTRQRSKTKDDRFSRPLNESSSPDVSPPRTESPLQRGTPLKVDSNHPDESTTPQTALPTVGSASSSSSQISVSASDELASEMLDSSREKVTAKVNGGSTFIMPNRHINGSDSSETESPIGEDDPWTAIAKSQEAFAKANEALSSDSPISADSDIESSSSFGGFNDKIFNGQSKPATSDEQPYRSSSGESPTRVESQSLKSPKDDTSNLNGVNEAITTPQEESIRDDEADYSPPLSGLSVNGSSGVDLSPIPASFAAVDSQIQESALSKKVFDIDPSILAKKREPIIELEEYCEPGKVTDNCSEAINGFLSDVADTGKAVKDSEAEAIVGYLDSLPTQSSNSNGAAFTSYLDALSTGCVPPPPSSEAVNGYLHELKKEDGEQLEKKDYFKDREPMLSPIETISKIQKMETRLTNLESKVSLFPDEFDARIDARLDAFERRQEQRLSNEMEKIMRMLVDEKK